MKPRDAPIAEAAAKAGFDCSNWKKLEGLITAVKDAVPSGIYPDRYTGAAAYRSSLYPDEWRPKGRRGVPKAYADADRATSVPAFAKTVSQILKDVNDQTRRQRESSTPTLLDDSINRAATGTNRQPLAPRSGNARTAPTALRKLQPISQSSTNKRTAIDLTSSSPKRPKIEDATGPRHRNDNQIPIIDLTITSPVRLGPSTQRAKNHAARNTHPQHVGRSPREPLPQNIIHNDTTTTLARCASKLRGASHDIEIDRDSLRERWEMDAELQLQDATENLADLNARFMEAEQAIANAVAIVEVKLLHR